MDTQCFDIIIVGAGPAGAACAIQLADSGLNVALLDKATFPRDKTCGDGLTLDVVNQLGWMSPDLLTAFEAVSEKLPCYGVRLYAPDDSYADIPSVYKGKPKEAYLCKRIDFDNFLAEYVKKLSGITFIENCEVISVDNTGEKVVLVTSFGNFSASMMVGADGAHSIITKQLSDIKVEKEHYCAGLRVYYKDVLMEGPPQFEVYFLKDVIPGYFWIFPLPNNTANVGIGMLSSSVSERKVNLKEMLQRVITDHPQLKKRFEKATPLESIKGYGLPLGSKKRKLSGKGFLLTGDAASLIDPFSGEGVGNALRSGRIAAEHVKRCIAKQDFSASFNQAYDKEIYKRMGKYLRMNTVLQKLFAYPFSIKLFVKMASSKPVLKWMYRIAS